MGGRSSNGGNSVVSREKASEDWYEYEYANLMSEYIRTGKMPLKDMTERTLSKEERSRLMKEAQLIQQEAMTTNSGHNTLYRGVVMSEEDVSALKTGQIYRFPTLSAASPDKKLASMYHDVENFGGGEGVPVLFTIQRSGGIQGFRRDEFETVLGKNSEFRIAKRYVDSDGVYHVELYAAKKRKK